MIRACIVASAIFFTACKLSAPSSAVKADPVSEATSLTDRGIIVWGDESSSGFGDDRWQFNGRNLAPDVLQFLSEAEGLDITLERLKAYGWPLEQMPKEPMTRLAQIDVNPDDSPFAQQDDNDMGFFINKEAFVRSEEYRRDLVSRLREHQDKRLAIEIGQRLVLEKYAANIGGRKFDVRVEPSTSIEDRQKVIRTLEMVVSQLQDQDYGVITSIYARKDPSKSTPIVGGKGLGTTMQYQLYVATADFINGNAEAIMTAIRSYDPVKLKQEQEARRASFRSSYGSGQ